MPMTRSLIWIVVAVVNAGFTTTNARAQTATDDAGFASIYRSGQSAMAAGRFDEALVDFERLEKMDPNVAEVHATLGVLDYKLGDFDRAIEEIRTARRLKPDLRGLDALLSLSLAETGRYSESLPGLERGFKQVADAAVQRACGLHLLRIYPAMHRDLEAIEVAVVLNRAYPGDPEVLYHTGRVYGNEAYVVMTELHDKAPNSIWMLQAEGEANESQKNYETAIMAFNHVLTIDPRRPGIHYRLGRVYLARFRDTGITADRAAAKKEFAAELEIDPRNGNAAYELAQFATEDNDLDQARKFFEAVVDRFPKFEQALVGLGGVYLETHATNSAVETLVRATKLDSSDEVAWYRLAKAERAVGHREAANKALDTFRSLHSSTASARNPAAGDEVTPQKIDLESRP
jgi:tetratricopeptide (TPR) repeat protein